MQLYLVRHPKPLVAPGLCYGASDVLCRQEEIRASAELLGQRLPKGLKIISSPLQRCEQLAQTLCQQAPHFSYETDEKLAEMNFGSWEMLAWDQIAPHELAAWTQDFASYRCGGCGESVAILLQRVACRLHATLLQNENQIWITHAGVIRAVQWLAEQPDALIASLTAQLDPVPLLSQIRAAEWPAGEVAFGQLWQGQPLRWPLNCL
jgi:alpha-ribazole phosphatase